MMPRWQRAFVIAACALIGGALAYALCDWARWPKLAYLPLRGHFTLHAGDAIAITYPGMLAWGAGGAACGALLGAAACAIVRRPLPDRVLRLLGAWAITAILLAGLYFTWTLWPWL